MTDDFRLIQDQLNREVSVRSNPSRIISVVPSQTELLFDLGLDEEVVGITKFCIHPDGWFRAKTRVGGTKKLDIEKIRSLLPDLIIANKEENTKEDITILEKEFPVWISDIKTLDDAFDMIRSVSCIVNREEKGKELISGIREKFILLSNNVSHTCVYLIWNDPIMTAGSDTFIDHMLMRAGFKNIVTSDDRYPETTMEELRNLKPEYVLLSSEPFPFKENERIIYQENLASSKVILVDGEMFSWYGSRLLKTPDYFISLRRDLKVKS